MNKEETLEKAIDKAVSYGFKDGYLKAWVREKEESWGTIFNTEGLYSLIFSHEFAKAFWGEEKHKPETDVYLVQPWQYHLQQMVLEEDPIKYLEKFI
jgi:hypothetical protein